MLARICEHFEQDTTAKSPELVQAAGAGEGESVVMERTRTFVDFSASMSRVRSVASETGCASDVAARPTTFHPPFRRVLFARRYTCRRTRRRTTTR